MSDDFRSHIRVRGDDLDFGANCRTRVGDTLRVEVDHASLADAYRAAVHAFASEPPLPCGHRIYWTGAGLTGATDLLAKDAAYKIVGRHTACDISLGVDSAISLRHLVLRSVLTSQGELTLRILDLHSTLGFRLTDGVVRRSVVARGPIALELGGYAVVALPSGELPDALPDMVVEDATSLHHPPQASHAVSQVSVLPRATEVFARPAAVNTGKKPTFSLRQGSESRYFFLAPEELDQGILVGRYPTASVHSLLDKNVSRLHLLLVREDGNTFAVDLCSTNGTYVGEERVRRVKLLAGAEVRVGTGVFMRWGDA
jgi:hypothetical protein